MPEWTMRKPDGMRRIPVRDMTPEDGRELRPIEGSVPGRPVEAIANVCDVSFGFSHMGRSGASKSLPSGICQSGSDWQQMCLILEVGRVPV